MEGELSAQTKKKIYEKNSSARKAEVRERLKEVWLGNSYVRTTKAKLKKATIGELNLQSQTNFKPKKPAG